MFFRELNDKDLEWTFLSQMQGNAVKQRRRILHCKKRWRLTVCVLNITSSGKGCVAGGGKGGARVVL